MRTQSSVYAPDDDLTLESCSLGVGTVDQAIKKAQEHLLCIQSPDGYWVGELEADVSVTSGYIPLMYFMTGEVDRERQRKVVNYVIGKQRADGSWSTYYAGPGDLNVTTQTYFALKLAGISPAEPFMRRAREFILSRGGISKTNTLTKIWLAIFGQFDWRGTPTLPPELILLPNWFYFNIYELASWSRATVVALMIVLTRNPFCEVPDFAHVSELYVEPEGRRRYSLGTAGKFLDWKRFFLWLDRLFKILERSPAKPWRGIAVRRATSWMAEHQEADGSWGGIMLPWVYSLIALKSLGYPTDHPVIARGLKGLEGFIVEDSSSLRLQPATSPVWDTAWAVIGLRGSGLAEDHPALVKAAGWLLEQEVRSDGDWRVKNPKTKPGCWAFEFRNERYPDIDDTAVVARALLGVRLQEDEETRKLEAAKRGLEWIISMQSDNGGWAAFDRNNSRRILAYVPFADFMTPLDPTSPDVTAHAVELLGAIKRDVPSLRSALSYLKREQEPDGAWYGRWGVNYLYGTGLVLACLKAAGENMTQDHVCKAVSWLKSHQNPDGGWGETCQTYSDPSSSGIGPSTASQTAWALIGLISTGEQHDEAARRGIRYLVSNQEEDGSWKENAYTGTGFPRAFYLRYDLYRIYFPLIALAQYRASLKGV